MFDSCVLFRIIGFVLIDVYSLSYSALQLMFCAGWVHRDISSGNIMAYRKNLDNKEQPWRVILADLEYAKRYPSPPDYSVSHDPKTVCRRALHSSLLTNSRTGHSVFHAHRNYAKHHPLFAYLRRIISFKS